MDTVTTLLKASDICFSYGQHRVLSHVTFQLSAGSYTAIVGSNGSGKSTLARCIAGLLQPDSGEISVFGDAGIVFQSPSEQIVAEVAEEDTAFGPCNMGIPSVDIPKIVADNLSLMSLLDYAKDETHTFSPGMKQRLVIAGILALSPQLLIFDESSSMIDPAGRKKLLDFISELHKKGRTIIHITHDMEEAVRAERIIVLHCGQITFDGSAEKVFSSPSLADWGLSLPDGRACCDAVRSVLPSFNCSADCTPTEFADEIYACVSAYNVVPYDGISNMAHRDNPVVLLDSVSFSYEHASYQALCSVSHTFYAGTVTAIAGKTGAGKSTLMQLAAGLIQPTSGSVIVPQESDYPVFTSGSRIFPYCIQEPDAAVFCQFAGDDVAFGVRNQGYTGRDLVHRTTAAMNTAGLPFKEFRDRPVYELSGGERRKVGLAGILAIESRVFFFDEPTMGLDPASRHSMLACMQSLAANGAAVVFSTHRLEEAAVADEVICMEQGRIAFCGTPLDVFNDPQYTGDLPWIIDAAVRLRPLYANQMPCCPQDFELLARHIAAAEKCSNTHDSVAYSQKVHSTDNAITSKMEQPRDRIASHSQTIPSHVRNFYPASKYLTLFAFMLMAVSSNVYILLSIAIGEICLLPIFKLSCRRFFCTVTTVIPFLLLISVLQLLFFPVDTLAAVYFQSHFITLTSSSVKSVALLFLHFLTMMLPLWTFIQVTSRTELMDGITQLLAPLRLFGVPIEHVGLLCMMVFRFIPLLQECLERILIAQRSRGADTASHKGTFFARVRRIIPVSVPLIICTLRKAELLAEAVAARRYGWTYSDKVKGTHSLRTSLYPYKVRIGDVVVPIVFLSLAIYMLIAGNLF